MFTSLSHSERRGGGTRTGPSFVFYLVDMNVTLELGRALERIHFRSGASGYWWISIEDSSYFFNTSPWSRVSYSSGASLSSYLIVYASHGYGLASADLVSIFVTRPS